MRALTSFVNMVLAPGSCHTAPVFFSWPLDCSEEEIWWFLPFVDWPLNVPVTGVHNDWLSPSAIVNLELAFLEAVKLRFILLTTFSRVCISIADSELKARFFTLAVLRSRDWLPNLQSLSF